MKRICLALGFLLAAGTGGFGAAQPSAVPHARQAVKRTSLRFAGGRKIMVDVMDTPAGRERGLMFRRRLARNYGMLFVFPAEAGLQFWMKNTFVSLDIVFISRDKRVTVVHKRVRASTADTTDADVARVAGAGQYVLELPAGAAERLGLRPGQPIDFEAEIPKE